MTDPSTPVPSDEAKTAAARILAREYGYDHVWENDVGEEVYDRHYWDHIGKAALTAAYAIDAPRIAAEAAAEARARCDEWDLAYANLELRVARAAAEARAATLREVEAWLRDHAVFAQAPAHRDAYSTLLRAFAAYFNPEVGVRRTSIFREPACTPYPRPDDVILNSEANTDDT